MTSEQLRSQFYGVPVGVPSLFAAQTEQPSSIYAMLSTDYPDFLDLELIPYCEYEAKRRGITIQEAYRDEMDGQERARRGAFTSQEIQRLVETSQPDPRLLDGDEECPF